MIPFILWYLTITILGWMAFPLAFRLLPALPERGYTFARILGWLLLGYFFWLSNSLGAAQNDLGGIFLSLFLLLGLSLWAGLRGGYKDIFSWVKRQYRLIFTVEALFLLAFGLWAFIRATNPSITGTEKPMELAFINAILNSSTFPPHDPWLSGYAISYYYFGYVLVGLITRLTGVATGIAFNLAISLIFGLTAIGAYGLIYNLLNLNRSKQSTTVSKHTLVSSLFGPLFILIVSNLEGFLEILHARGLFWTKAVDGTLQSRFWSWLGILELNQPPSLPFSWMPNRQGGVLFWRGSRVLADYQLDGGFREVIDEFPFFSFLLADLHPHVLAMPFALLVIGLALHVYIDSQDKGFHIYKLHIPLSPAFFAITAISLGGLAFLNTWDFPIYVALFSGAYALKIALKTGWRKIVFGSFIQFALILGITGAILYLPFYIGFSSQAGGFLPSLIFFTQGVNFWVMFAPLLIPIFGFLFFMWNKRNLGFSLGNGLRAGVLLIGGLWVLSSLFGFLISQIPAAADIFLANQGASNQGIRTLLLEATKLRLLAPGTWVTIFALIVLVVGLLSKLTNLWVLDRNEALEPVYSNYQLSTLQSHDEIHPIFRVDLFVVLLILVGVMLVLVPEFFYLRDQFGGRMNTIFKFYYQTWLIWGIAAAYATVVLLSNLRRWWSLVFRISILAVIAMSLAYPLVMTWYKTDGFQGGQGFTLDGTRYRDIYSPDETAAINWLLNAPLGVVAEAVGGQYSDYGRVSTHSGHPAVLGWPGHQGQWRGGYEEVGSREQDIETLYRTNNWDEALRVIQQYDIRYVFVGGLERSKYRVGESKFEQFMTPVFSSGIVTIYETRGQAIEDEIITRYVGMTP